MSKIGSKSKIIELGKISNEVVKRLKLQKIPRTLIIFDIDDILKHIDKHYINGTEEELESKIRDIIVGAKFIAYDKLKESLQFIKVSPKQEMVVFRSTRAIESSYVKSVYPTTINKIRSYYQNANIDIICTDNINNLEE